VKQQNHKQIPETVEEEEELKEKNSPETTEEATEIEETVPVAEPKGNEAVEGGPAAPGDVVADTTEKAPVIVAEPKGNETLEAAPSALGGVVADTTDEALASEDNVTVAELKGNQTVDAAPEGALAEPAPAAAAPAAPTQSSSKTRDRWLPVKKDENGAWLQSGFSGEKCADWQFAPPELAIHDKKEEVTWKQGDVMVGEDAGNAELLSTWALNDQGKKHLLTGFT
jgi:hypothetical protein